MTTIIAGIDVGLSGALCLIDSFGTVHTFDMPTHALTRHGKNKREIDAHELARMLSPPIGHAFVEQVGAMPGQGVSGVFAFGKVYGIIIGILAARSIPVTFVAPRRWKTALGVPAAKDGARARASQLMPDASDQWRLVKHDGRAEAALIALYGTNTLAANTEAMSVPRQAPREPGEMLERADG